jgi:hypothetical protein
VSEITNVEAHADMMDMLYITHITHDTNDMIRNDMNSYLIIIIHFSISDLSII